MGDFTKVTVLILWKSKKWEERDVKMQMPEGSTEKEVIDAAVKATMSGLASLGNLDEVHTMGVTSGFVEVEMKEKKEDDATPR
jgi:hypothetical protein